MKVSMSGWPWWVHVVLMFPRQQREAALSLPLNWESLAKERPNVICESLKYTLFTLLLEINYTEMLAYTFKNKYTRMEITAFFNSNNNNNNNNNLKATSRGLVKCMV